MYNLAGFWWYDIIMLLRLFCFLNLVSFSLNKFLNRPYLFSWFGYHACYLPIIIFHRPCAESPAKPLDLSPDKPDHLHELKKHFKKYLIDILDARFEMADPAAMH